MAFHAFPYHTSVYLIAVTGKEAGLILASLIIWGIFVIVIGTAVAWKNVLKERGTLSGLCLGTFRHQFEKYRKPNLALFC